MAELDADVVVQQYLDRIPRGHELHNRDPLFHGHITWLRTIWPPLNRVLAEDGVSGETRERALNTIVYGSPDPTEAIGRLRDFEAKLDLMQRDMLGDLRPGHQFTGIDGLFGGEGP